VYDVRLLDSGLFVLAASWIEDFGMGSEVGLDIDILVDCEEVCGMDENLRCDASVLRVSSGGSEAFWLGSDSACGLRKEVVVDLLKLCFSSFETLSASI
jgi:hypothetical protein